MIREILWIATKLGFCALVAAMLLVWQGGWWYVRPHSTWINKRVDGDSTFRFQSFVRDDTALLFVSDSGFKIADASSGTTLLQVDLNINVDQFVAVVQEDADRLAMLVPSRGVIREYDLGKLELIGETQLPSAIPRMPVPFTHSKDRTTIYVNDRADRWWSVDAATAKAKIILETPREEFLHSSRDLVITTDKDHTKIKARSLGTRKVLWERDILPARLVRTSLGGNALWVLELNRAWNIANSRREAKFVFDVSQAAYRVSDGTRIMSEVSRAEVPKDATTVATRDLWGLARGQCFPEFDCRQGMVSWFGPTKDGFATWQWVNAANTTPTEIAKLPGSLEEIAGYRVCNITIVDQQTICFVGYPTPVTPLLHALLENLPKDVRDLFPPTGDATKTGGKYVAHFMDPSDPTGTIQRFEERVSTYDREPFVWFSSSGRWMLTEDEPEDGNETLYRLYDMPIRTPWGLRLAIAVLTPLVIFIVVPTGWCRMRNRRTARSRDQQKPL